MLHVSCCTFVLILEMFEPFFCVSDKSRMWGLSHGGLRPLSAVCAQSSTIVCPFVALSLTLQSLLFCLEKKKKQGPPEKNKDSLYCRTPEILGKESKNAQKSKENRKTKKKQGKRKERKDWRVRVWSPF